jgi:hypothetical protein
MLLKTASLTEALGHLYDVALALIIATVQPKNHTAAEAMAYVQQHPFTNVAQLTGAAVCAGTALVNLVLSVADFSTAGLIAGSLVASWQSTMGSTVTASSAFKVCQSVAMGGTSAAHTIYAMGVAGSGIATVAAVARTVIIDRLNASTGWLRELLQRAVEV